MPSLRLSGRLLYRHLCRTGNAHVCPNTKIIGVDRDGAFAFALRYLTSRAARAAYEADAYRCNLELHHWHTGTIRSPRELAERLRSYGVRQADIDVAETTLIAAALEGPPCCRVRDGPRHVREG